MPMLKYAMVSILHGFETFTNTDVSYVRSSQPRCHHIEKLISQLTLLQPAEWSPNSPHLRPVELGKSGILELNSYRGRRITDLSRHWKMLWLLSGKRFYRKKLINVLTHSVLDSSVSLNLKESISKNWTDELMKNICLKYLYVVFNNHSCLKTRNAILYNATCRFACSLSPGVEKTPGTVHDSIWITESPRVADGLPC